MRSIYRFARTCATLIVLSRFAVCVPEGIAATSRPVLWTQANRLAAGDRFLAVGYAEGIEIWSWNEGIRPAPVCRREEYRVSGLWVGDQTVVWTRSDSTVHLGHYASGTLTPDWSRGTGGGTVYDVSASDAWVGVALNLDRVRIWSRASPPDVGTDWYAPGGRPLFQLAIRDSTMLAGGGDWLWLARLRADTVVLIDSVAPGAYVQDALWAADTLLLAFGGAGLKVNVTAADRFGGSLPLFSDGGIYAYLAAWDAGWAGLDAFGRVQIFRRGDGLVPVSSVQSSGTPQGAAGRGVEAAVLTLEFGLGILNAFTLEAPFWSYEQRLPGIVRALEYTPVGLLAHADFTGVHCLDTATARWVMYNPYNAVDLDYSGEHVVATGLLSGAGLFPLAAAPVTQPDAVLAIDGLAAGAEWNGDQVYTVSRSACNRGFHVYDATDPTAPVLAAGWSTCVPVRDLEKVPGGVALAMSDSGIWIFATPILDSVPPAAQSDERRIWDQLAWRDGHLWSRAGDGTVKQWHWDGVSLVAVKEFRRPRTGWMDASGDRFALACSTLAIEIYDWTGDTPELVETVPARNIPLRVALVADTLWWAEVSGVMRADLGSASGVDEPGEIVIPADFVLGAPYPNPFNSRVRIPLALRPGDWRLAIYNVLGQKVASWEGVSLQAVGRTFDWRPAAGNGTAGPSAVYFIRIENAGTVETRKATHLK